MTDMIITTKAVEKFCDYLREDEKSSATDIPETTNIRETIVTHETPGI